MPNITGYCHSDAIPRPECWLMVSFDSIDSKATPEVDKLHFPAYLAIGWISRSVTFAVVNFALNYKVTGYFWHRVLCELRH